GAIVSGGVHRNWGGTALIGPGGDLRGTGSVQTQQASERGSANHLNMVVPIDLLPPILDDLLKLGRPNHPPRPWLGLYATEIEDRIVIVGLAGRGPAERADLRAGDVLLAVAGTEVSELAGLFRKIWSLRP